MINTFRTLFEARERKFQQERLFRGESVDLVAKITTDGVMDTLSGYSISGVYQPTDELSGSFYPVDAEIVDGKAILHWTNDNDFGKDSYNVWGLLTKDGKAAYPICWRLMFAHSPSYPLGTPDPIPRTIDFSQYELLNAPWVPLSGGNLSGRIYLQVGETPSTLLSSYLGDATGLGRGIITIYDETEESLEAKLTQSGASVAAKWIFTYYDTPTGEIEFPDNPQPGDTFDVLNGIGTKYLNGADVTMEQGTTMFQWQTGDTPFAVPCLTLHNIVTRYTYNSVDGWTASSTYDWSICKVDGEWYANSFDSGHSAHDSIVWHEESSGEQPILDPFVLKSELDEAVEETKEDIKQTLQDEYLPLSGGTVSGDFAVENFLSSTSSGVFLGKNQDLNQYAELAIGNNLSVGMVGLAMGSNSEARSNDIAIGHNAKSPYGGGNIVIGNGASTAANGTTVVGTNAKASGGNAIAIGTTANATHSGEVRLGGPQGSLEPQLWLFDTPILSGPNTVLLPERVPYLSAYAKTEDLADYATQEWVEEYVDEHGGASGDYLPLSGGNLSGRIYLVETEDPATSVCIFQGETQTWTRYIETWETEVNFSITSRLSVYDAGQEFIDMLMNSEEFSEEVLTTKNVSVEVSISETDTLQESWTLTASGQVGFGNSYAAFAALHLGLDINNDGVLIIDYFTFDDSTTSGYAPLNPGIWIYANLEGVADTPICDELLNDVSKWTIEEIGGTGGRNANDPFVLSSELSDYYTKTEADGKFLTAHQSLEDYYTKQEADGKFLTAHQDLTDYATKTYVQEYVDEHAGTPADMSACLSSDEFISVDFLSVDENKSIALSVVSLTDIGNKINQILVALKRMAIPDSPIDLTKTRVVYTDNSTVELDLTGNVLTSSIPNISNVKAISFGTNVTSLANSLFSGNTNLVSAEIPGTIAAVPQNCFYLCKNLASLTLHEGVTSLGNSSIQLATAVGDYGNTALTALTLPNSLTSIGNNALKFCNLRTLTIPKNVTSIGNDVFSWNRYLTEIVVDAENTNYKSFDGAFYSGNGLTCYQCPPGKTDALSIAEGTTTLADGACCGLMCSSLTLPSTLTTIGRYSCIGKAGAGGAYYPIGFSSITIPSTVTSIGEYAFSHMTIPFTMEGKTIAQVNSMSNKYWDVSSGASFICTDGTITR